MVQRKIKQVYPVAKRTDNECIQVVHQIERTHSQSVVPAPQETDSLAPNVAPTVAPYSTGSGCYNKIMINCNTSDAAGVDLLVWGITIISVFGDAGIIDEIWVIT